MRIGQRFNPHRMFTGVFIADAVYSCKELSAFARLIYGRLCKFKGERGDAYPSAITLAQELGISERQAFDHISRLVEEGFIEREPRLGTSTVYHFLWHKSFEQEDEVVRNPALPKDPDQCGIPHGGSAESRTTGSAESRVRSESIEVNQLSEEEDPPTPFSEKPPEQTPLTPADLSIALSNLRRGTRAGRIKGKDLEVLDESLPKLMEDNSAEELLGAYQKFLQDEYWIERKAPTRGFISQLKKYLPQNGNGACHAPVPPTAVPAAVPLYTPSFPERWNALVPERTIDPTLFTERPAAYQDLIFQARFDDICGKFRSLIRRGAKLTYRNLFRKDKDTGSAWWNMALTGDLEWIVPKKSGSDQWDDDPPVESKTSTPPSKPVNSPPNEILKNYVPSAKALALLDRKVSQEDIDKCGL